MNESGTVSQVRELRLVYSRPSGGSPPKVGRPADVVPLLQARLEPEAVEVCVVLLLNTKHRVIGLHEVGRGTLDSCLVHPREVFKAAIFANAAGLIFCHNHPSGDPTPSPEDFALCTRLRQSAEILGIELFDFVIVGAGRYYSFMEAGR